MRVTIHPWRIERWSGNKITISHQCDIGPQVYANWRLDKDEETQKYWYLCNNVRCLKCDESLPDGIKMYSLLQKIKL